MNVLLQSDSGGGGAVLLVFALFGLAAYFLPTIVAVARKVPNVGSVAVINTLLGWTFIGWVVSLAMAARSRVPQYGGVAAGPYPNQPSRSPSSGPAWGAPTTQQASGTQSADQPGGPEHRY